MKYQDAEDLYTFDTNQEVLIPEEHNIGCVIPPAGMTVEELKAKGIELTVLLDRDLVSCQDGYSLEFQNTYRQALALYLNGHWDLATTLFEKCIALREDPPSMSIVNFMASYDQKAPEDWPGYRMIVVQK